jgi:hypothetical protein
MTTRARELRGAGGWINTDMPVSVRDLRGRVVVLDFWTFCCINCLRVVEELRDLEVLLGSPGSGVLVVDVIASTCSGDVCTVARSTSEHPLTVA